MQVLLDWLARQPEARLDGPGDPRAGMEGVSYAGGIELVAAGLDKRIDAIAPTIAWHSLLTAAQCTATGLDVRLRSPLGHATHHVRVHPRHGHARLTRRHVLLRPAHGAHFVPLTVRARADGFAYRDTRTYATCFAVGRG